MHHVCSAGGGVVLGTNLGTDPLSSTPPAQVATWIVSGRWAAHDAARARYACEREAPAGDGSAFDSVRAPAGAGHSWRFQSTPHTGVCVSLRNARNSRPVAAFLSCPQIGK